MQKLETAHQLQARLRIVLDTVAREFKPLTDEQLRWKPNPDKWSIIECLQHLNLAERFYIRNIQHKVDALGLIQTEPTDQTLEGDLVGRTLRYVVDPKTTLKIPAPGIIRPRHARDLDVAEVMTQFIELQTLLHDLLNKAVSLDWNQTKLMTIFGNWLKIRMGDAMLMLVAHSERHINQAMRVKALLR